MTQKIQSWAFLQEKWKLTFTQNLICVYSFIAALFVIAPNGKLLKCPSMVNAELQNIIDIMEYYPALNRKRLLILATTWMNSRKLCLVK